jgi:hypothetical protein
MPDMKTLFKTSSFFHTSTLVEDRMFHSEYQSLAAVAAIASIAVLISSLQSLSLFSEYADSGLFSWHIHRTRNAGLMASPFLDLYDCLFQYPSVLGLFVFRVVCAAAVLFTLGHPRTLAIVCGLISLTAILLSVRGPDGENGADEMMLITFVALTIVLVSPHPWVWRCGLLFLAGQLLLAYCTSGYIRIREKTWRDGSALLVVLRQHTYGNRWCWSVARRYPIVARVASMSVLIFECSTPLALLLPMKLLLVFLAFGVAFHLLNAIIIGLNTFFWAFLAAYPAFIWSSAYIQRVMWH